MEIYKSYVRRKNNFPKYLVIIVITVILTLFADRTIKKANEIDDFAEKLELEQEINIQENTSDVNIISEDYIEDILNSTVGISFVKPTGSSIFDINIEQKWGIGTGVIVSEKGYILTNQHLANKRGAKLSVTLHSGKTAEGKVVWTEENIDLAIIKIEENNLKPVKIGDSDKLKIGNDVIAIRKSTWSRV